MAKSKIKTLQDELINAGWYEMTSDETAEQAEGFFLTPIRQSKSGLSMNVYLRCLENKSELPFLRFQNDRNERFNYNWVKMYIDGTLDNYENKKIVFTADEIQTLKDWIALNKEVITKHYYQEYDSADVCREIKKL